MSSPLAYISAALSTVFRLAAYLFLRVGPSEFIPRILAAVYALHLSTLYLVPADAHKEPHVNDMPNGNGAVAKHDAPAHSSSSKGGPATLLRTLIALAFSFPSPGRMKLAVLAINIAIWMMVGEFMLHPVLDPAKDVIFTRVGAIYPDSVRLVVRYPHPNATEAVLRILWRQTDSEEPWSHGLPLNLSSGRDWVNTATIGGLWPSTSYEYIVADAAGDKLPYPVKPIQFHTFPDPRLPSGSHFRFLASSCILPNYPYRPLGGLRLKGFDLLADYLWPSKALSVKSGQSADASLAQEEDLPDDLDPPAEFLVFLGDFIYADVPYYFGDDAELYRRLYRRNYKSESLRKVYEHLPIIHTYDDHEIINNYVGAGNDSNPPFVNAADAFRLYNADANHDGPEPGANYFDFRYADTAFFVMDTRRYRSDITKTEPASRTMLGEKQLDALYNWLGKVNDTATFKFIVSSVPFTTLWGHDAQTDAWPAYQNERTALLATLHTVPNVIIISGDRHEFAAIKFNAEGGGHNLLEISTSPLSMFYVPILRMLRMTSENLVKVTKQAVKAIEGSSPSAYVEELPQEQVVKYIAEGNYKWSSFEVDTRNSKRPVVNLEAVVDGLPAYHLEIVGKPVELHSPAAFTDVIAAVPNSIKGILDRLGLGPSRWFGY